MQLTLFRLLLNLLGAIIHTYMLAQKILNFGWVWYQGKELELLCVVKDDLTVTTRI